MREAVQWQDSSILQTLRSGDSPDEAIRLLYRLQFIKAQAYITANGGNAQDAEDIFQEALLVFIEAVVKDKFRGESSIGTFLQAVIRNLWLNELKKRSRSAKRELKFERLREPDSTDAADYIIRREQLQELFRLIETLGETCRKILLAVYYENLPMKEILQQLSFQNEQVVRNKKYKCLKELSASISAQPMLAKNLQSILYGEH